MSICYTSRRYWSSILNASLCKFFILRALCDGPAHGYEIIRRVATLTDNFCVPTQGTIYPVLREFQECGCVTCLPAVVNGRTRKVYTVTRKGRDAYKAGADVWEKGLCCVKQVVERKA
jgi:DNA-binding PadR family transcriptional regulator